MAQLEQIDKFISRKIEIGEKYRELLEDLPIETHEGIGDVLHTKWMCSILVNEMEERDQLRAYLKDRGIETRPTFYPVHTMPMYSEKYQRYPNAEYIGWRGMNLPSWPGLEDKDIKEISNQIHNFYGL